MILRIAKQRRIARILRILLVIFLIMNVLAYVGAYYMTHTVAAGVWGFGRARPTSKRTPADAGLEFVTRHIPVNGTPNNASHSTEQLEAWYIPANAPPKGTILLFPGNGGSKGGQLIASAEAFHQLGYDALLVDFQGVGGSSGNTTTVGAKESGDVATAIAYAQAQSFQRPYVLYGVSMGTAAILRSVALHHIQPDALILELPFTNLLDSVKARLRASHLPTFPTGELIVFWGSVQHGFNGFTHNPLAFARSVRSPTLVLQGEGDRWISMSEINRLMQNLGAAHASAHIDKELVLFPKAGHRLLVTVDGDRWTRQVAQFLAKL